MSVGTVKVLDWTKRGPGTGEGFEIDFADILTHPRTGVQTGEISSVSAMFLEKLTSEDPIDVWDDVTSQVSFGTPVVANGDLTNSAVTFVIAQDKDATPADGEGYRVIAEVVLNNGQGEAGFAPMRIWSSAAVS